MEHLNYINRLNINRRRRILLRRRQLVDRSNPMNEYLDDEFKARYRFSKNVCLNLFYEINIPIKNDNRGGSGGNFIPPIMQFLIFLRFIATGSFQVNKCTFGKKIFSLKYLIFYNIILNLFIYLLKNVELSSSHLVSHSI